MKSLISLLLPFLPLVLSLSRKENTGEDISNLRKKWAPEHPFGGVSTFAHLQHVHCLTNPHEEFDIAILGAPFDTAVSYRPGARFGPRAIRAASARQSESRGFNVRAGINPYLSDVKILDCGDIPISPFDNELALRQMTEAYKELMSRPTPSGRRPIIVTLGGDHSIGLAALRGVNSVYGPVSVVHFDAHLDTWYPTKYPSSWPTLQSAFTHGTMFHLAYNESLLLPTSNVHAGLRTRLSGADMSDYADDDAQGWARISTDDIDDIGVAGIVKKIVDHVGNNKVYLSIDIDVLDPGIAPGTGTPEAGGWTMRELIRILRGIEGLDVVGVDVVEVAPAYDCAENTALAASQVVFEVLSSLAKKARAAVKVEGEGEARDEL
ncbi:arginase family-domain-containing protein [Tuber brumale]|nr:arginase family-domain-containing protein [Tuber brumale]